MLRLSLSRPAASREGARREFRNPAGRAPRGGSRAFLELVADRLRASGDGIRRLAAAGEAPFVLLPGRGVLDDTDCAVTELADLELG